MTLMAGCVCMILAYAFNVYRAVSLAVSFQGVVAEQRATDLSIDMLDVQYIAISRTITPDSLVTHGFDKGIVVAYISRTAPAGSVAFAGYEF